jgi:hypothetical protein
MIKIGELKRKDEVLFTIRQCYGDFFCLINPELDWSTVSSLERVLLGDVFELIHSCLSVAEMKEKTKYYVNDYHFEWEI